MDDAGTSLTYVEGELSGQVNGELTTIWCRHGVLRGTVGEKEIEGLWRNTSNYQLPPDEPLVADAVGWIGDTKLSLQGHLYPIGQSVMHWEGSVSGYIGDAVLRAAVHPASQGLSSATLRIDGYLANTLFDLHTTVGIRGLPEGWVRGTFGGSRVDYVLEADEGVVRMSGEFRAPNAIVIIATVAFIEFGSGVRFA